MQPSTAEAQLPTLDAVRRPVDPDTVTDGLDALSDLPGADCVLAGLRDVASDRRTAEAALVQAASHRFSRHGIVIPGRPEEWTRSSCSTDGSVNACRRTLTCTAAMARCSRSWSASSRLSTNAAGASALAAAERASRRADRSLGARTPSWTSPAAAAGTASSWRAWACPVVFADHSQEALDSVAHQLHAEGLPGETWQVDLEAGTGDPLAARRFSAALVFRYLHRPLMPHLRASILPGGLVVYETFTPAQHPVRAAAQPGLPAAAWRAGRAVRGLDHAPLL
jgi:hypothetical protein